MKAIYAILLLLSTGQWAIAQEMAANRNGKQESAREVVNPALSGSGTKNYIPLWLTKTKLGTSEIYQTDGDIGIGTTTPAATLDVNGAVNAATSFNIGGNLFAFGKATAGNAFLGFAGNTTMGGGSNTASGVGALYSNTIGAYNTATGNDALAFNTTGGDNTANGALSLQYNTGGGYNTAAGEESLQVNTTGSYNAASGFETLVANTTGNGNTANGYQALQANTTGSYNTALGYAANVDTFNLTTATAIGAGAVVGESNALVLGGTGSWAVNVGIGTATPSNVFTIAQGAGPAIADGWNTYSSRRWKTNIRTLPNALSEVEQLRGVSYDLKDSGKHEIGLIGEEVGAVVPEVVTWEKNGKDAQGVDYGRLTALLIEATKEQQALIHKQQEEIARLTAQVRAIRASLKTNGHTGSEVRTVKAQVPTVQQ